MDLMLLHKLDSRKEGGWVRRGLGNLHFRRVQYVMGRSVGEGERGSPFSGTKDGGPRKEKDLKRRRG